MSIRTKVLVLLTSVAIFSASAAAVALFVRARAGDALARVAERELPLVELATTVAAAHLEQAIHLERAVRLSRDRASSQEAAAGYGAAKTEYESLAREIWRRLQEARTAAEEAAAYGDAHTAEIPALVRRIDAAHNAYAAEARSVFALLDEDRRKEALARVRSLASDEDQLQQALGALLLDVAQATEDASSVARQDERRASWIVGGLLGIGLLLSGAVFLIVVRLVSEVRSLGGLLPICAHCKKIRDDRGYWNQLEAYLEARSEAAFTHGICSDCQARLHATLAERANESAALGEPPPPEQR